MKIYNKKAKMHLFRCRSIGLLLIRKLVSVIKLLCRSVTGRFFVVLVVAFGTWTFLIEFFRTMRLPESPGIIDFSF